MTFRSLVTALALAAAMTGWSLAQPAASDPSFDWAEEGRRVYQANCASCHGPEGAGIAGAFPPLAGHVAELVAPEGGRVLLVDILLYGLAGPIEVAGNAYNGAMPGWSHLSDEQIAAVLNHSATAWGTAEALDPEFVLYGPADVAAERDKGLTPSDVLGLRASVLGLASDDDGGEPADAPSVAGALDDSTGFFTLAQAERGRAGYERHCTSCHNDNMRGGVHMPGLTGLGFFRTWSDRTLDTMVAYIRSSMPPNAPGSLSESAVVDIVAYWLQFNDYPYGDVPLPADPDVLRTVTIERR